MTKFNSVGVLAFICMIALILSSASAFATCNASKQHSAAPAVAQAAPAPAAATTSAQNISPTISLLSLPRIPAGKSSGGQSSTQSSAKVETNSNFDNQQNYGPKIYYLSAPEQPSHIGNRKQGVTSSAASVEAPKKQLTQAEADAILWREEQAREEARKAKALLSSNQ
jgi:hypothetical protein